MGILLHLANELRLVDRKEKDNERNEHNARNYRKEGYVIHKRIDSLSRAEDHSEHKNDNSAKRSHKIYYCVCLRTQRLYSHVGHKRHGGRTEGRHCKEHHEKHADKYNEQRGACRNHISSIVLSRGIYNFSFKCCIFIVGKLLKRLALAVKRIALDVTYLRLDALPHAHKFFLCKGIGELYLLVIDLDYYVGRAIVKHAHCLLVALVSTVNYRLDRLKVSQLNTVNAGKADKSRRRNNGSENYKWGSSSTLRFRLIGKRSEKRKQEKRKNIVKRHNNARPEMIHTKLVCKYFRNN